MILKPLAGLLLALPLLAQHGPLGIDHKVPYDDHGIWSRKAQSNLEKATIATELIGALWLGTDDRLGKTFWRSVDASALDAITVLAAKRAFSRARPEQTDDPNQWFQGSGHTSFPSGEVSLQAAFVTPFIAEYAHDAPWVWALELLPAYDAVARVKTHGHWQSDVLVGWAVGTAFGLYAHGRTTPLTLGWTKDGAFVGFRKRF